MTIMIWVADHITFVSLLVIQMVFQHYLIWWGTNRDNCSKRKGSFNPIIIMWGLRIKWLSDYKMRRRRVDRVFAQIHSSQWLNQSDSHVSLSRPSLIHSKSFGIQMIIQQHHLILICYCHWCPYFLSREQMTIMRRKMMNVITQHLQSPLSWISW